MNEIIENCKKSIILKINAVILIVQLAMALYAAIEYKSITLLISNVAEITTWFLLIYALGLIVESLNKKNK